MWKWILIVLLVLMALGLWMILDPNAPAMTARAADQARTAIARAGLSVDASSLFAPISRAFGGFARSVSGLLSPRTIHIQVPGVQVPK